MQKYFGIKTWENMKLAGVSSRFCNHIGRMSESSLPWYLETSSKQQVMPLLLAYWSSTGAFQNNSINMGYAVQVLHVLALTANSWRSLLSLQKEWCISRPIIFIKLLTLGYICWCCACVEGFLLGRKSRWDSHSWLSFLHSLQYQAQGTSLGFITYLLG